MLKLPRPWRHASQTVISRLAGSPRREYLPGTDKLERVLVIRLGGMGKILTSLPLIWSLRENWPQAQITMATEENGRDVARICPAINEVIPIQAHGWYLRRFFLAARKLQGYDAAIAASSTYDRWLARLVRLTNAPVRIGVEPTPLMHTPFYYTHNMASIGQREHECDALLRLAEPLEQPTSSLLRFDIQTGQDARYNAKTLTGDLTQPIGESHQPIPYVVVDISSDGRGNWDYQQYADFIAGLAGDRRVPVAITYQDQDLDVARKLTRDVKTFAPVRKIPTRDPEQLAAVLEAARVVFSPNYAIGQLAAAVDTPAVILWLRDDFAHLHSLHPLHLFIRADEEPETATPTYALTLMAEAWENHPDEGQLPPPAEDSLA